MLKFHDMLKKFKLLCFYSAFYIFIPSPTTLIINYYTVCTWKNTQYFQPSSHPRQTKYFSAQFSTTTTRLIWTKMHFFACRLKQKTSTEKCCSQNWVLTAKWFVFSSTQASWISIRHKRTCRLLQWQRIISSAMHVLMRLETLYSLAAQRVLLYICGTCGTKNRSPSCKMTISMATLHSHYLPKKNFCRWETLLVPWISIR